MYKKQIKPQKAPPPPIKGVKAANGKYQEVKYSKKSLLNDPKPITWMEDEILFQMAESPWKSPWPVSVETNGYWTVVSYSNGGNEISPAEEPSKPAPIPKWTVADFERQKREEQLQGPNETGYVPGCPCKVCADYRKKHGMDPVADEVSE